MAVVDKGAVPAEAGPEARRGGRRCCGSRSWSSWRCRSGSPPSTRSWTIIAKLTAKQALNEQQAGLNASHSSRRWLDFTYQVLDLGFSVAIVALVAYLLLREGASLRTLGFDFAGRWRTGARCACWPPGSARPGSRSTSRRTR